MFCYFGWFAMLRKLPRQFVFLAIYGYLFAAALIVVAALLLLNTENSLFANLVIMATIMIALGLIWWLRHPRLKPQALDAAGLLREAISKGPYVLLAFESEYCGTCMAISGRITQLDNTKGLKIYRLSVNKEPGRTLFKKYDGRITPTYVLLNDRGEVVQDWPVVLPIDRVLYAVRPQAASPNAE
jgi:thioredoxin-related protein